MEDTMKRFMFSIAAILMMFMISACGGTGNMIKIGFVNPLTGDVAALGESSHQAALLAVEEINAAGGVNGKLLELIPEDGLCKGSTAATVGNKLISVDKVIAINGAGCSSETLAIAPIAEENKVVLFSPASSSPEITGAGDFIFRSTGSDEFQGNAMAEHLIETGYKNAAAIFANSDYNIALKNAFKQRFEELGGTVIKEETYEQDSKDFRTQLTKIKAENPQALYMVTYLEAGLLMKQARELGITAPFFAGEAVADQKVLDDAGNAAEGLVYATPKFDEESSKSKKFLDAYKAKYGEDPNFAAFAANSYDNMYLLADAIRANGETGEGIRDYLYTVKDYDGAGGMLTIDENGDAIKSFQLMTVKGGKFVKLEADAAPMPPSEPDQTVKDLPSSTVETVEVATPEPEQKNVPKLVASLIEWQVQPGEIFANAGAPFQLQVVNRGASLHSGAVRNRDNTILAQTGQLEPGAYEILDLTLPAGRYEIVDPEDWMQGMRGLLIIE